MVPIARRVLFAAKVKFLLTVLGVGTVLMLILFLVAIFEGVKEGSTGYIVNSPAEIWICQKNSTNLLRSSSFIYSSKCQEIEKLRNIKNVEGILRIIATAQIESKPITLFIFGFDPNASLSSPITIEGSTNITNGEIILDESFANKYNLSIEDTFSIKNRTFQVAGISTGTNATLAQFSFTTIEDAQQLLGFSSILSFYLVSVKDKTKIEKTLQLLKHKFPDYAVYNKEEFIQNNIDELKTGVLPILGIIALLGFITGITIITLMLYSAVQERREDYALLKAIGMQQKNLIVIVFYQSIIISFLAYSLSLIFYAIFSPYIVTLVPEISMKLTLEFVVLLSICSVVIGLISSFASIHKLSGIYPAEVFRA